jgi:hypothetical protein
MSVHDEDLSPDDVSIQTIGTQQWSGAGSDSDEVAVPAGYDDSANDNDGIVAAFQRSAAARAYAGGSQPRDGSDIAAAAREHLRKTAEVLPDDEARELIMEGAGERARNLNLLDLKGTHYEQSDEDLQRRGVNLDEYDDDVVTV